jgi:hypothetical protein
MEFTQHRLRKLFYVALLIDDAVGLEQNQQTEQDAATLVNTENN